MQNPNIPNRTERSSRRSCPTSIGTSRPSISRTRCRYFGQIEANTATAEGTEHTANLRHTGLKISRLCLGTMNFGPYTSETDSFGIMNHALELGINIIDTANVYGGKLGKGITEKIIGRWLAQGGRRRGLIMLGTKVYCPRGVEPRN